MQASANRAAAVACGVFIAAVCLPGRAHAEACTGTEPRELISSCLALAGNQDLSVRLIAAPSLDRTDPNWIRNALNRVIVYVGGYNVGNTSLPAVLHEDGGSGVLTALHAQGISIVIIAPGLSRQDGVEDDAEGLRRAFAILNGYRGPDALPLVVLGHSMGGLMSRIALARMEAAGEAHEVALYISYDSPHSGVNVPQGMQNLKVKADEWAAMTKADFVAIDPGWEGVFNAAALSGMTSTVDPKSIAGFPDPTSLQAQQMTIQPLVLPAERAAFVTLLDATGFPAVRKIAVSNGNTLNVGNTQTVSPGGELFYFTGDKGTSAAAVRGTFEVFTDSPGATCFRSHVYYDGVFQDHDGGRKNASSPANLVLLDHLSGGTIDYAAEMAKAAEASKGDFYASSYRAASNSAIPFVPTSSALGLPVSTSDADLAGIVADGGTPFDRVFAIGDLPNFARNIDHNTVVLPDALVGELTAVLRCQLTAPGQDRDADRDGLDDACDADDDGDEAVDTADNCLGAANQDQSDSDADGVGDVCDETPFPPSSPNPPAGCGCGHPSAPSAAVFASLLILALRWRRRPSARAAANSPTAHPRG